MNLADQMTNLSCAASQQPASSRQGCDETKIDSLGAFLGCGLTSKTCSEFFLLFAFRFSLFAFCFLLFATLVLYAVMLTLSFSDFRMGFKTWLVFSCEAKFGPLGPPSWYFLLLCLFFWLLFSSCVSFCQTFVLDAV